MAKKRKNGNETPLWIRIMCGALGVLMILSVVFMVIPYLGQSISHAEEGIPPSVETISTDRMISVGLRSGSDALSSFSVQSNNGFSLAYRKSDKDSETLLSYPSGPLAVAIDDNLYRYGNGLTTENLGIAALGGYHIQVSYFTISELGIDDRDNPVYIEPSVAVAVSDGYDRDTVNDFIELLASISYVQAMEQPIFPYYSANKTYIRLGSYYTAEDAEAALEALERTLTLKAEVVSPSERVLTVLDSSTWTPVCELSTDRYALSLTAENDQSFTDSAGHIYCGSLLLNRAGEASGKLIQVVNRLPLEEYVAALLSFEVSANEDAELLKAMAIILRTEATRHTDAHKADGYDVCSDSHCHRFSGSMANATSIRRAVLETSGEILTYNGKPIYTPFTVQSGATTISSEDAFGKQMAYLPALITPWEDSDSDNMKGWSVELSPYELYCLLIDAGYTEIKGNIQSVTIERKAEGSDYVTELSITDLFGNSIMVSGSETIRALLGGLLPSADFVVGKAGQTVTVIRRTLSGQALEYTETTETIELKGRYDSFVFSGRGIGCGVGFSIAGGRALAEMGYTYDQMLAIYYPETRIKEIIQ